MLHIFGKNICLCSDRRVRVGKGIIAHFRGSRWTSPSPLSIVLLQNWSDIQLQEVSKWYSGFTPLIPGAIFLLVPSNFLFAFAAYHVALRGNTYVDSHQKLLAAMRAGTTMPSAWPCLVLARLVAFISRSSFTTNMVIFLARSLW